jgi:hypothetical protein
LWSGTPWCRMENLSSLYQEDPLSTSLSPWLCESCYGQRRCPQWLDQEVMLCNGLTPTVCPILTSSLPPHFTLPHFMHPFFPIYTNTHMSFLCRWLLPHNVLFCENYMGVSQSYIHRYLLLKASFLCMTGKLCLGL